MDSTTKVIVRFFSYTAMFWIVPWGTAVLTGVSADSLFGGVLIAVGGISPTLGALLTIVRTPEQSLGPGFLRRLSPGLLRGRWVAVVLLLPAGVAAAGLGAAMAVDPTLELKAVLHLDAFRSPLQGLGFLVFVFIFGPLPEELGWRGFVLDPLSRRVGLFRGSVVISVAWMVWHVPLFFIAGYPLREMALRNIELLLYFGSLLPKSILYSWIWSHTGKSTFGAILFHFSINFCGMIVDPGFTGELASGLVYSVLALAVLIHGWRVPDRQTRVTITG